MQLQTRLRDVLSQGPSEAADLPVSVPVAVYGAGSCGHDVARALQSRGYDVLGLLDKNAAQKAASGPWPCLHPQDDRVQKWRDAGAQIVIGLWNAQVPIDAVAEDLKQQGWQSVFTLPQVFEVLHQELGDRFWLSRREIYRDPATQDAILSAFDLWSDEQSREVFVSAIEARLHSDVSGLNREAARDAGPQYLPRDVAGWPTPQRFVDGGAFDGDTLRELPWPQIEAVAAFEPDVANFSLLAGWCREAVAGMKPEPRVALWPCGLWNETTTLRFEAGSGASSSFSPEGSTVVPVVALDDVLSGFAPDCIKLDIEGAEPQAIQGARLTIEKHLPALAVCVYHQPQHLWTLVRQVAALQLPYKYFLRAHWANGLEWVLYAVP